MSADNWDVCPACEKVFPSITAMDVTTFREDYEFYLDTRGVAPVVRYSYSGFCQRCGTGVEFSGEVPLVLKDPK